MRQVAALILVGIATSAGALDPNTAKNIDTIFADLNATNSPGCALGVIADGSLVYGSGYGMASLEHQAPIDVDTVFYTGSVSKQFAAAAVAMAAREGHLSLDDDIRKWFPEIPDYGDVITVRHLVHHTSGLRDYLGLMALAGVPFENVIEAAWVLDLISRQQATNFAPGEKYLYSNSGYFLLAQLVGRATGQSLREYTHAKFFAPLGMDHTHFHDDRTEVVKRRAAAYTQTEDGGVELNWSPAFDQVGSGGLLSTIVDLVEWDRSYYDGRLGEDFWDGLQTVGVLNNGDHQDYAFGLVIDEHAGHRRVQHGGSMFGYRAQLSRYPDERLTVAVLCNLASAEPDRRAEEVASLLLPMPTRAVKGDKQEDEAADTRTIADLSTEELETWVGEYRFDSGIVAAVELEQDKLTVSLIGQKLALQPLSANQFLMEGYRAPLSSAELTFNQTTETTSMTMEARGNVMKASRLAPRETDSTHLAAWVGRFSSEELMADAVIELKDNVLTYKVGTAQPREIHARDDWTLSHPFWHATATRGERGEVETFIIDAGRVKGITFSRD